MKWLGPLWSVLILLTEIMNESLNELKEVDNFSIVNQVKSYFTGLIMQAVIGLLIGLIFKKADPNAID